MSSAYRSVDLSSVRACRRSDPSSVRAYRRVDLSSVRAYRRVHLRRFAPIGVLSAYRCVDLSISRLEPSD